MGLQGIYKKPTATDIATTSGTPSATTFLRGDNTWQLSSGVTLSTQTVTFTTSFTTTSASLVDITGMTLTLPNRSGGIGLVGVFISSKITL